MPYKDPEKRKAYHGEYTREWKRKRYANDPEWRARENERNRAWQKKKYAEDPEYKAKRNAQGRERMQKRRETDLEFKALDNERSKELRRKLFVAQPWLKHFNAAKARCNNPNHKAYKWYGSKDIRMLLTKLEVELLYKRDYADQMEQSSIDRLNPKGDYHFGNCRFIEVIDNVKRRWQEEG